MARPLLKGVGPLRFGFVTDTHNADRDDNGNRYYRDVPDKIADAVALFNDRSLDIIFINGDVVDGYGGSGASAIDMNVLKTAFSTAKAPRVYAGGNHDYQAFTLASFAAATGMDPQGYYYFDRKGVRVISLDANYEADDDSSHYSAGGFSYTDTYINPAQRTWLSATLASAPGDVVIICHQRLELQVGANYVKNADAVRAIIDAAYPKVKAVLMGHAHVNSLTYLNGTPYVVMQALIEGAHPLNAYAVVSVENGFVSIEGFGQQTSWGLLDPFPESRPLIERFAAPPHSRARKLDK
jgi:UDP-2,3-diacylglucosamine pyrophosphatase LpxH